MKISESYQYIEDSLLALKQRSEVSGTDNSAIELQVRYAFRDYGAILQIWLTNVPSRYEPIMLWDSLRIEFEDKLLFHAILNWFQNMGFLLSSEPISKIKEVQLDIPMFEFHPQRVRAIIPSVKAIGNAALNKELIMFTMEALQFGVSRFIQDYNSQLPYVPSRYRSTNMRAISGSSQVSAFYGHFVEYGRQIFNFPKSLVESFRKSDVEDIPLEAIQLPYEAFYLHFGVQDDLEMAPGWRPDGAYVSRVGQIKGEHVIQFCLTSLPEDRDRYENGSAFFEPYYIQGVTSSLMCIGIGEAVDRVMSEKVAELLKQSSGSLQMDIEEAKRIVSDNFNDFNIKDVSTENAKIELEKIKHKHAVWREMLNLVINSIAYLTSYRDDIKTEWPDKTPKALLENTKEGTDKQKTKATSKLAALGYTAVHMCGVKFEEAHKEIQENGSKQKKTIWVRGSWVWQAHGIRHSLRRLQWRMPHVKNKIKDIEEDTLGHLYLVQENVSGTK